MNIHSKPLMAGLLAGALSLPALAQTTSNSDTAKNHALDGSLGGRVQLDHARFRGVYSNNGASLSTTYLRRVRLSGQLRWHAQWRAGLALETDDRDRPALDTAYIAWQPGRLLKNSELLLGRIEPDFGLEQTMSSAWTAGIERSAIWDLAPDLTDSLEGMGLQARLHTDRWHVSAGVYDKRDHSATVLRVAGVPWRGQAAWLHAGGSWALSHGWEGDGRIRSRLGVRGVTELDAGRRTTLGPAARAPAAYSGDRSWGLEAAWVQGPWSVQAETLQRRLQSDSGLPTRTASGRHVQLAWVLTGEARSYDERNARFGRIKPRNEQLGAVELFYRHDTLSVGGERGAELHTLGASWFSAETWRVMLNLHRSRSDQANAAGNNTGTAVSARVQASF